MSHAATQLPLVVLMGVSGSGKTTLGQALAARLGWPYQDGDDFHSEASKSKMRAGVPLDDSDRAPWLAAIASWMDAQICLRRSTIIGCSALKRKYREFLRSGRPQLWFLYLRVPRLELERRVISRQHAYMPALLLDKQLDTLEEPGEDEPQCLALDAGGDLAITVDRALRVLAAAGVVNRSARASKR